jgi:hypothetical protein
MSTFDEFWAVYPRRLGGNPKHPALLKFETAVKNGADPAHIVSSARRYAEEQRAQNNENTPFVCMAKAWLHQKRWLDYAPEDPKARIERDERLDVFMTEKGYLWNGQRWEKLETKKPPPEGGGHSLV